MAKHGPGCTCSECNASAQEAFEVVRAELVKRGWAPADVYSEHTGGNVWALAVVLKRAPSGRVLRQALLGDPYNVEVWGGMIEDLEDPSRNIDDLPGPNPSSDSAQVGARWLDATLRKMGYGPAHAGRAGRGKTRKPRKGRALRDRYGRARYDRSSVKVNEIVHTTTFDPSMRGIVKAAGGAVTKKLGITHEAALRRVGAGLYLGPWSKVLLYSPALRYWPKPEHKALLQLVKRGDLRVIEVSGDDLKPWIADVPISLHPPGHNDGYVVVPASSLVAQGIPDEIGRLT